MGWYQRRVHGGATFRMDCKLFLVIASVVVLASLDLKNQAAARSCGNVRSEGITVFNFTDVNTDVSDWVEVSDNVRTTIVGQSKATLVLHKNSAFQRGIFFGLLNPQVGGACFTIHLVVESTGSTYPFQSYLETSRRVGFSIPHLRAHLRSTYLGMNSAQCSSQFSN